MKVLIIGDTQVRPGLDLAYCSWIGKYILHKRPDIVVHIGDHWDLPSLSSYDKGKRGFEGRRLLADLKVGSDAMKLITGPTRSHNSKMRGQKKAQYNPEWIFTTGNHEQRLMRATEESPELDGVLGDHLFDTSGWLVAPFLEPVNREGINFVHYLANPFSGKPYGGSALNQLKHVGTSFVVGHKQLLDIAIKPTLGGKMQIGIINGSCYLHDEEYKGPQGNTHYRGLIMLHEVKDGFGLPMPVSLEYLGNRYN